jgi:hypothetical protein
LQVLGHQAALVQVVLVPVSLAVVVLVQVVLVLVGSFGGVVVDDSARVNSANSPVGFSISFLETQSFS